jgi:hypothetical protein
MTTAKFPPSSSREESAPARTAKPHRGPGKLPETIMHVRAAKTSLHCKNDFLCVLSEFKISDGKNSRTLVKEWYPVHPMEGVEARALVGRPVTAI